MAKQGFISWSGEEARLVAEQLQKLFAHVLAAPTMFVASKDLKAGEVWFTEIANRLEASDVGVIVVTPQNVSKPWLHFEAGAIAKRVGRSAAIPLLCGVSTGELSGTPLAQLQAITTAEDDIRELCGRLNDLLELGLTETHISEAFPVWWEKLASGINNPEIWKGAKKTTPAPTTSDLSVQLSQLAAAVAEINEFVRYAPRSLPTEEAYARAMALESAFRRETARARNIASHDRIARVLADGGPRSFSDLDAAAAALQERDVNLDDQHFGPENPRHRRADDDTPFD